MTRRHELRLFTGHLIAVALLLLAAGARLHHVAELGAQADEGVHITAAVQVANGDVLYRDLFENRTPGVIWLLAVLFRAGGESLLTGRVLATGASLITVAALFAAGRLIERSLWKGNRSSLAGMGAAFFFALAPLPIFWSRYTMLEHFSAAATVVAIAAALRAQQDNARRWWLAAGVATGLAILAKQVSLVVVVAMILFFALWAAFWAARDRVAVVRSGALWAGGVAAVTVLFLATLAIQGAWQPFFRFVSGVGRATVPDWTAMGSAWWPWLSSRPFVPLAIFGGVALLWKRSLPGMLLLLWATGEVGALMLAPQLTLEEGGFSHYVPPAVAALTLLAGIAIAALSRTLRQPGQIRRLTIPFVLLATLTIPGWLGNLHDAITEAHYPQPGFSGEVQIGRSAALLSESDRPIVVLGNAIFYYRASRPPATPFFHLPGYLRDSPLSQEAAGALDDALSDPTTGAVVLSRLHLDERLPPPVETTLWRRWEPVARFPYPYQRGVFLFQPRSAPPRTTPPLARFGDEIALLSVDARRLSPRTLLVGLTWKSDEPPAASYTAFAHLLNPDGHLLAQHDGIPVVGFRPTETWQAAEQIVDWHWITIDEPELPADVQLSVGLYHSQNGERLPSQIPDGTTQTDSYTMPLTITE